MEDSDDKEHWTPPLHPILPPLLAFIFLSPFQWRSEQCDLLPLEDRDSRDLEEIWGILQDYCLNPLLRQTWQHVHTYQEICLQYSNVLWTKTASTLCILPILHTLLCFVSARNLGTSHTHWSVNTRVCMLMRQTVNMSTQTQYIKFWISKALCLL